MRTLYGLSDTFDVNVGIRQGECFVASSVLICMDKCILETGMMEEMWLVMV